MKSGNRIVKQNWDLSLWFAVLSPLIGALVGIFALFVLYH